MSIYHPQKLSVHLHSPNKFDFALLNVNIKPYDIITYYSSFNFLNYFLDVYLISCLQHDWELDRTLFFKEENKIHRGEVACFK